MDLGTTFNDDFFSSAGLLSQEEMDALLNPANTPLVEEPSAIQVLLNQGAEYLAAQQQHPLADLNTLFQTYLRQKSPKILSITPTQSAGTFTKPLTCPFEVKNKRGFIALDWTTCYILIDALLGGINGVSIEKKQEQPYSLVEKNILMPICYKMVTFIGSFLKSSANAWPLETCLPPQTTHETRFTFVVRTAGATGKICLCLPDCCVPQPKQELLFENHWDKLLSIPFTPMATLKTYMTLKNVFEWSTGSVLQFSSIPQGSVEITCHQTPICHGRLKTHGPNRQVEIQGEK